MFRSTTRWAALALMLLAGCGAEPAHLAVTHAALNSCNVATDCPPATLGTCVKQVCNADHTCGFADDTDACATGCTVLTEATDCIAGCVVPTCVPAATTGNSHCDFTHTSVTCACATAADCTTAPSSCQNMPTCQSGVCTYTAKTGAGGGVVAGCCNATSDCSGTATCDQPTNTCTCSGGKSYCPGTGCIDAGACCTAADCAPEANATATCVGNACVYTCDNGFHDCTGTCKSSSDVGSCGTLCSPCPSGNACQTPTCAAGACGFVAAGGSPCCNVVGDCVPMNACQQASACTANQCVFTAVSASNGCCNSANDCPVSPDPCLTAACVANQCAFAPVSGCSDDGGAMTPADLAMTPPADMAVNIPVDDLGPPLPLPDLSAAEPPLSLTGGGGCAIAAAGSPAAAALLVLVALLIAFRRRASDRR